MHIKESFTTKEKKILLKKEFGNSKPFKHIILHHFFDCDYKKILTELKKEEFEEKVSDLFEMKQTVDLKYTKNKTLKEVYSFFKSKELVQYIEELTGIKLKGEIDMSGSLYSDGSYLLCHDDQLEGRKIAFIYYLNNLEEEDGGSLIFRKDKNGRPSEISHKHLPRENGLVLFEVSKKSWHEVEEVIGKERYAIGGWFL